MIWHVGLSYDIGLPYSYRYPAYAGYNSVASYQVSHYKDYQGIAIMSSGQWILSKKCYCNLYKSLV